MKIMTEVAGPRRVFRSTLIAMLCLSGGCVYRMPIQQGNFLDPADVAQVKPGMTRSQVRYLLGTPMVPDTFDHERWDYGYYLKTRRLQTPKRSHVVVYFSGNLVARVDSDLATSAKAPASAPAATSTAPK